MMQSSYVRIPLILFLAGSLMLPTFRFVVSAQQETRDEAFSAKADHLLKAVRHAAEEDQAAEAEGRLTRDGSAITRLSRRAAVGRKADGTVSVRVAVQLIGNSAAELNAAGFAVGSRIGDVATVTTEVERLPELAALSTVRKISASVYRHPRNDRARQAIGVDNSAGQRVVSQTGRGVVVGIIDTGIDFRHLDFTVPGSAGRQTRIKALLDMTVYSSTATDWNYALPGQTANIGHLYTTADINAALQQSSKPAQSADIVKERDKAGHGTHVAGTAAGNGLASPTSGTYAGMAPEADLIIVKASRENDGNDGFAIDDIINGLSFIRQKAAELGEPFVINLSLGGHGGSPHDGTDPDERAIDNLINSGAGRAVCVAAGNEGQSGIHASGNVTQGGNVALTVTDPSNPQTFTLYYPNTDRFSLTVTLPNGTTLNSGTFNGNPVSNQYITIYNATDDKQDSDPSNDQSSLFVDINSGAESLGSNWTFTLHGTSVSGGHFEAWVDDGSFAAPYADDSKEVGSPGTSRGAITVGAYVTRSASQTIGNYAYFTSPGPTADGRQKPDISTPGYYLYSSRSTDMTGANASSGTIGTGSNAPTDSTHYIGFAGTSMATPVTTGAVVLLMQANRSLTTDQVKQAIFNNATHDGFTGGVWEPHFGNGKLNIAAALNSVAPAQTNPIDDARVFVTQHYRDFLNREPDAGGLAYWTNQITGNSSNTPAPCAAGDANCMLRRRIGVSAAFFIEQEFQLTGSYVYRMYTTSLGRQPTYAEFNSDRNQVVANANLDQSKAAFADAWVQRPAFINKYGANPAPDVFVDALLSTLKAYDGVDLSAKRATYLGELGGGASRGQIVREMAEDTAVQSAEYNPSFVLMQYFGYLRRDPEQGGYLFWLNVLNNREPNNYRGMVCSFITSAEYQLRFGSVVTHSNQECAAAQ
jgi:subtilisin family serine protease